MVRLHLAAIIHIRHEKATHLVVVAGILMAKDTAPCTRAHHRGMGIILFHPEVMATSQAVGRMGVQALSLQCSTVLHLLQFMATVGMVVALRGTHRWASPAIAPHRLGTGVSRMAAIRLKCQHMAAILMMAERPPVTFLAMTVATA